MIGKNIFLVPAVIATLSVAACSSDSDDPVIVDNATTDGDMTTVDNTGTDTITGGANTSFFNDESGVAFANDIGSDISRIFSSAFSAIPLLLGSTQGDLAPRLARANQSGTEACFTSGTVDYSFITDDATGSPQSASINFNNCNEEGIISTGGFAMTFTGDFEGDSGSFNVTFSDFTVSGDGEVSMINGAVGMSVSTVGDSTTATIQGDSLSMSSTGGDEDSSVTFSNFQLTSATNDTTGDSSLSGQSDILTPEGSLNISINPAFQVTGDADFPSSGVVTMNASDGSSLQIDADTGNPATYNFFVTDQGGSVSSGTANWADSGIDLDTEL